MPPRCLAANVPRVQGDNIMNTVYEAIQGMDSRDFQKSRDARNRSGGPQRNMRRNQNQDQDSKGGINGNNNSSDSGRSGLYSPVYHMCQQPGHAKLSQSCSTASATVTTRQAQAATIHTYLSAQTCWDTVAYRILLSTKRVRIRTVEFDLVDLPFAPPLAAGFSCQIGPTFAASFALKVSFSPSLGSVQSPLQQQFQQSSLRAHGQEKAHGQVFTVTGNSLRARTSNIMGEVVQAGVKYSFAADAHFAELEAIKTGLIQAKARQWTSVVIESDSALAIKILSDPIPSCPWSAKTLKMDCVALSNFCTSVEFRWIPREINFAAHNFTMWSRMSFFFGDSIHTSVPDPVWKDTEEWKPSLNMHLVHRYISTYRIVERGYGWSGRECRGRRNGSEREREKGSELEREGGMAARERGKKARS
ncbi:hypothetical protein TIFTF001_035129 [Ficus carica]|uniref:RNase H type-1 domain-containing protein n=1 Tax=Ficus carica TaxID=3494 RepID=A0AA88E0I9_FICCA|nr:hypothetical protein TIFTF001_034622 [Ficus carica]GMN66067.1 hypothetical protein TIFTF001_035129 [Ficus carica]